MGSNFCGSCEHPKAEDGATVCASLWGSADLGGEFFPCCVTWGGLSLSSSLWIVERWLAAVLRLLVNLRKASLQDWLLSGIWLPNTFLH